MSHRNEKYHSLNQLDFIDITPKDYSQLSDIDISLLWRKTLQNGMHGVCFSAYTKTQKPGDVITEAQIQHRMQILKPYTKWVRSFSCIEGNEIIPKVAKQHGIKTLVGAWLSNDLEKNEQEIEALISLAKKGLVDIAAVGNEVLYRNDLSLQQLIDYMYRVKEAIPNIPIGYVDAYYEFTRHPILVTASDVILSNCYPFWEGCPIEHAQAHMQQMYGQSMHAAKGKKVIITETGWPSQGQSLKGSMPSARNAMQYFINAQQWSKKANIEMFYFSSFDEAWKVDAEGDVGAFWGIWGENEQLKF